VKIQTDACEADRLLPEERVLWTGQPGSARTTPGEVAVALYLAVGLAVLAVAARSIAHSLPGLLEAFAVIAWGAGVVQALAVLIYIFAIKPRVLRGTVYQVTDYRVIVTAGLLVRREWSAYLDQLDEPVLRRGRDGSESVVLRSEASRGHGPRLTVGGSGPFSSLAASPVPVLRALHDGAGVQQMIAAARRQLTYGLTAPVLPLASAAVPWPADVGPGHDERTLWTGMPARPPWWFGAQDAYLSVFGVIWLACMGVLCAFVATGGSVGFLVFFILFATAGGVYPAFGRIVHRRLRIRRSTYLLTSRRLIVTWQLLGQPVTVQADLMQLLPPSIDGQSIICRWAPTHEPERITGWKGMLWPAATNSPPSLIGIAEAETVRALIGAAQLALRVRNLQPPA